VAGFNCLGRQWRSPGCHRPGLLSGMPLAPGALFGGLEIAKAATMPAAWSSCVPGRNVVLEEFKKFALRGNVVDLAVGVIIGAAFGAIVASLVGDIIMPIIGAVTGGLDFSNYFIPLSKNVTATSYLDAKKQGAVLGYGQFLTVAINFMIIAFVLFLMIRLINQSKKQEDAKPTSAEVPADVKLLTEIRDLLARRPA
jgi:large conductance mechanosensitive channel